jgi:hypothetical protein
MSPLAPLALPPPKPLCLHLSGLVVENVNDCNDDCMRALFHLLDAQMSRIDLTGPAIEALSRLIHVGASQAMAKAALNKYPYLLRGYVSTVVGVLRAGAGKSNVALHCLQVLDALIMGDAGFALSLLHETYGICPVEQHTDNIVVILLKVMRLPGASCVKLGCHILESICCNAPLLRPQGARVCVICKTGHVMDHDAVIGAAVLTNWDSLSHLIKHTDASATMCRLLRRLAHLPALCDWVAATARTVLFEDILDAVFQGWPGMAEAGLALLQAFLQAAPPSATFMAACLVKFGGVSIIARALSFEKSVVVLSSGIECLGLIGGHVGVTNVYHEPCLAGVLHTLTAHGTVPSVALAGCRALRKLVSNGFDASTAALNRAIESLIAVVHTLMQQHGTAHRGILDEAGYVLAAIAESDEPDSTVSSVLALARYGIYNELQRWSAHWAATPVEGIARCLAVMPCVRSTFLLASTFSCAAPHVQLLQTNCNSHYYY